MLINNSSYKDMVDLIEAQKQLIEGQDRLIKAQRKLAEEQEAEIALLKERNYLLEKAIRGLVHIAKGANDDSNDID